MKINASLKKEDDREERWYARMDTLEASYQTTIAEIRKEYQDTFIQLTNNIIGIRTYRENDPGISHIV